VIEFKQLEFNYYGIISGRNVRTRVVRTGRL